MPTFYDADGNEVEVPDAADLRGQLEAALKEKKDLERAVKADRADAALFRASQRDAALKEHLGPLGDQAVKVWAALKPDQLPTPETVAEFAAEFGYEPVSTEGAPPAPPSNMTVTGPATTSTFVFNPSEPQGGTPPAVAKITEKEYSALMATDPPRARGFAARGLVDWKRPDLIDPLIARATG